MLTPGDEAKIGGSPITGVAGPSGWVRSTISSRPAARSSTRCVSVVAIGPDYIRSGGAAARTRTRRTRATRDSICLRLEFARSGQGTRKSTAHDVQLSVLLGKLVRIASALRSAHAY